jgi:low affinity Fe/Cu permease
MSIESWSIFWKIVFVIGVSMFTILSILVIFGGARDIAKLIQRLKADDDESGMSETLSDEE